jgi:plastocyanin
VAGPTGAIADGVDTVRIGDNNVEYSYWPARMRVKRGAQVNFVNTGDIPHSATETPTGATLAATAGKWDTGILAKGQSKTVTFDQLGSYYFICTPHPWMYGQVIVEP